MSEKRKNPHTPYYMTITVAFGKVMLAIIVGIPALCVLFVAYTYIINSAFFTAIDKSECGRAFQELNIENESVQTFLLPSHKNIAITSDNVSDLVEVYRLDLESLRNSRYFYPKSIWFKSNQEATLTSLSNINSDKFSLVQLVDFHNIRKSYRICSNVDGSQLDFVYSLPHDLTSESSYPTGIKTDLVSQREGENTYKFFLQFLESDGENVLLQIPISRGFHEAKFSPDKTTLCALTSSEFICWGIPSEG